MDFSSSCKPRLAVVVLNYNSANDCRVCVSYLRKQQGVELEIIIVDNHSCQAEREKAEALCKETGCTFIPNDVNSGYNAGNNVGLRYAASKGYEYAAIANPDMEFPQADCLKKCLDKLISDNSVVVVAPDIVLPNGEHQNPQCQNLPTFWEIIFSPLKEILAKFGLCRSLDLVEHDNKSSRYCEKVSGCFFLIRMSFLKDIGFFDENIFLYCEEPILSYQVKSANRRMYYLAETYVVHRHLKAEKGNSSKRMKLLWKSQKYLMKTYLGFSRIQLACIFFIHNIIHRIILLFLKVKHRE